MAHQPGGAHRRVYLASTGRDVQHHREAVRRTMLDLGRFEVRSIEDLETSEDFYDAWIAECDLFIGVYGREEGARPSDGGVPFPEREYEAAAAASLPRLIYLRNADGRFAGSGVDGRVWEFRRRLLAEGVVHEFETEDEVVALVMRDLETWWSEHGGAALGQDVEIEAAEMPGPHSPRHETVVAASVGDRAAAQDSLGFAPYVRALAQFLADEATVPPLTLTIEGGWGSGKTSFMLQLEGVVGDVWKRKRGKKPLTVWFNAWRHDQAEALWAAFAVEFTRQVAAKLSLPRRWRGHLSLLRRRFAWRHGVPQLLRFGLFWLVLLVAAIALPLVAASAGPDWIEAFANAVGKDSEWEAAATWVAALGGGAGYLLLLLTAWLRLKAFLGNPVELDLAELLSKPDYQGSVSFIETFHEDFCKVVEAYAGSEPVYVFVDDLDRCAVPKAAELIEGLNLMMADELKLVFIIGMDREKVAAGLAVRHEKLLPYLYEIASRTERDGAPANLRVPGLEYGYEFIEKFVQVPFLVPRPDKSDLARYVQGLAPRRPPARPPTGAGDRRWANLWSKILPRKASADEERSVFPTVPPNLSSEAAGVGTEVDAPVSPASQSRRELIISEAAEDSERLREITVAVALALDLNPRRIKQFVNLFRLRTFIAAETGLFDRPQEGSALTLEQLGKFVALSLSHPLLLSEVAQDSEFLPALEKFATEGIEPDGVRRLAVWQRWSGRVTLLKLLRIGMMDERGNLDKKAAVTWGLAEIDVQKLLRVSPQVVSVEERWLGEVSIEAAPVRPPARGDGDSDPTAGDFAPLVPDDSWPQEQKPPSKGGTEESAGASPPPASPDSSLADRGKWLASRPSRTNVYASYPPRERREVQAIVEGLRRAGFTVWFDPDRTFGGPTIEVAPHEYDVLLLFLGKEGMDAMQKEEVRAFDLHEKAIVPVILPEAEPVDLPVEARRRQWVDLRKEADLVVAVSDALQRAGPLDLEQPA